MAYTADSNPNTHSHRLLSYLEAALGHLLLGELLWLLLLGCLWDFIIHLFEDHLDVCRAIHVWADTTVGTVSATTTLLSGVGLEVLDVEQVSVKILEFCIALSVAQEV